LKGGIYVSETNEGNFIGQSLSTEEDGWGGSGVFPYRQAAGVSEYGGCGRPVGD